MAAFNPFYQFVDDLANGKHQLETHQLKIALLTTTNPPVATDAVYADFTSPASTANLTASAAITVSAASGQTSGTYKLVVADLTMSSGAGNTGPFRYLACYNDAQTTPAKPVIGWWDYGSALTLTTGQSLTVDFSTSQVLLTIASA